MFIIRTRAIRTKAAPPTETNSVAFSVHPLPDALLPATRSTLPSPHGSILRRKARLRRLAPRLCLHLSQPLGHALAAGLAVREVRHERMFLHRTRDSASVCQACPLGTVQGRTRSSVADKRMSLSFCRLGGAASAPCVPSAGASASPRVHKRPAPLRQVGARRDLGRALHCEGRQARMRRWRAGAVISTDGLDQIEVHARLRVRERSQGAVQQASASRAPTRSDDEKRASAPLQHAEAEAPNVGLEGVLLAQNALGLRSGSSDGPPPHYRTVHTRTHRHVVARAHKRFAKLDRVLELCVFGETRVRQRSGGHCQWAPARLGANAEVGQLHLAGAVQTHVRRFDIAARHVRSHPAV